MARIIVFAPHPDDAELGMGGTIARLISQGHDLLICDMTNGEPTPKGTPETRAREAAEAAKILGVRRVNLGLRNRFVEHSIDARHAAAGVIRAWRADILFVPYFEDAHPDHLACMRIAEDARFDAKLTGLDMPIPEELRSADPRADNTPRYPKWLIHYYATHLRIAPSPSFLIDTTGFEEVKKRSILAYRSQFIDNEKNRSVVEWLDSASRYFGSRIGAAAAEPFFTREPIGLSGFDDLVM
ncbi:MAG TPA: PIG-L family deacetylase [Phycisphaerales bacterium]|nr:PIG-L family deacetylase [Phycisphaerales bacterium]